LTSEVCGPGVRPLSISATIFSSIISSACAARRARAIRRFHCGSSAITPPAPSLSPAATAALASKSSNPAAANRAAKAKAAGEDFEAVFLNSMFQQMFSGVGQGPFSGGNGASIWRSFLTDEYSKSFVKAGGIGIASEVQRALLAQQEVQ